VESSIVCEFINGGPNCSVVAQRQSTLPHSPEEITSLSFPTFFGNLANTMIQATGKIYHSALSWFAEWYIQDPSAAFILSNHGNNLTASLDTMTAEDFSIRLGQLLNTFLLASVIYQTIPDVPSSSGRAKNATVVTIKEVFACSWG
jgi:hypothetical protein